MLLERPKTAGAILLLQLAACSESPNTQNPPPSNDSGVIDLGILDLGVLGHPDAAIEMDAGEPPDAGEPDSGIASLCPPSEPFGRRIGEQLPPATLLDCDGNEVDFQGMCEKKASWMFHFAGW